MKETIIQFGEGNFLRGFADYFIHKLNEKGLYDGKAVIVQPIEQGLADLINRQNGEYNLFLRGISDGKKVNEHTKVASVSRAIDPYKDFTAYMELARNPEIRFIISNTTEAGIAYDPSCMPTDSPPAAFPAKLTLLLFERFRLGLPGVVLFPCELIDNNGDALRDCVLQYCRQWQLGEGFEQFIRKENTFCNTLVDRIVTGYPAEEAEELCKGLGYADPLLDTAEIFHLWVIEGNFEEELPLQKAGFHVIWTKDASPYKKRKVRVLNGAHTALVCPALLAGMETVGGCFEDEPVLRYLHKCLFEEILPTLGETEENMDFARAVLERFRNPFIHHRLTSIALNSVSKFAVRVVPTILEYKERRGTCPKGLSLSLAALVLYYKTQAPQDDKKTVSWIKTAALPEILAREDLWGADLSFLCDTVREGYERMENGKIREAIQWIL